MNGTVTNEPVRAACGAAVVVERALAGAVLADPVEIDIRDRPAWAIRKALGLGEQPAEFVDHGLAVPRQVVGRLALARGGVDVGRQAAERLRAAEDRALVGSADRDRAAREVQQHGCARQSGFGRGRDRNPHVLAHLGMQHEAGHVFGGEEQVRAEGCLHAADRDPARLAAVRTTAEFVTRGIPPTLVELAIGGQVRLGHDSEQFAVVDHHGAVVHTVAVPERCPDNEHAHQIAGCVDQARDRGFGRIQQGVLQHEVFYGVPGEAEFGEDRDRDGVVVALAGRLEDGLGVRRGITDAHRDRAGRNARKTVAIGVAERKAVGHHPSLAPSGGRAPVVCRVDSARGW